jgi:hypothetical protein
MLQTKQFITKVNPEIAKKRITEYLIKELFKLKSDNGEIFIFEKGSIVENHFTFNPRKWKSKVKLRISRIDNQTTISAEFDIDTIGQIVTLKEEQFWSNCVNRIENAANGAFETNQLNSSEGKLAILNGWKMIGLEMLIVLFSIFVGFIIVKIISSIF